MDLGYSRYSMTPLNQYISKYSNIPTQNRNLSAQPSTNFEEDTQNAKSMIEKRLQRLSEEKQKYYSQQNKYNKPYPSNYSAFQNFAKLGSEIMKPPFQKIPFFDPVHFPIEIPGNGVPINEPVYTLGGPVDFKKKCKNCRENKRTTNMLLILNALGYIPKERDIEQFEDPEPDIEIKPPPRIPTPKEVIIPPKKKKKKKPKKLTNLTGKNWWRLCKDFVNLFLVFNTARKYGTKYAESRASLIQSRTKNLVLEISLIKDWLKAILEPFWTEFRVFEDFDVSFKKSDFKSKKAKQSQKIIAIIKKFMENLIAKTAKMSDVPDKIQQIIYEYIKERAYFPKEYLTTFQTNRLDFDFYGASRNVNSAQGGMILAYLIICGVLVQQILIHMKDVFKEFQKFPKINISAKYIGSVIHYLTRDTFINSPKVVTNCLGLFNYYRNYHIYNEQIEKQEDSFKGLLTLHGTENDDEYAEFLIPEEEIKDFWKLNPAFVETYKKFIYAWSVKLCKLIKLKFSKDDVNLLPRRRLPRPKIKTMIRNDSDDEEDKKKKKKKKKENDDEYLVKETREEEYEEERVDDGEDEEEEEDDD